MTETIYKDDSFSLNNKISLRQLQALLFLEIFGFGVTALPRRVAEHAGQDGWVGVLLATGFIIIMTAVMTHVTKLFPQTSFYDIVGKILGRPLGALISLLFCLRLVLLAAFNLRIFAEITRQTMLPTTPFAVVFVSMLMIAAYGAAKGIESRARVAEVLILVVLLPLIFVFGISGRDIDFSNLMPVMAAPFESILAGSFSAFFAFSGIEVLLLVGPFLARPKHLTKSSTQAIVTIGIFMAVITAVTIARFGPANIVHQMWPVLKMMDTISLPGSIIDRQGALIMTFWIISAYATINAALFFSSLLLKDVVTRGKHSWYILGLIPIIALVAHWPTHMADVYTYFNLANRTLGVATMIVVPLVLFAVASIRRMGRGQA
ncbi:MAG: spore germination protein [Defluviitaleaceae bacterium]|nr:spore germination protein [Defluviitaleaceae bacterium]